MGDKPESKSARDSYGRDQVVKIINSVLSKVEHPAEDDRLVMYQELKELKRIIEEARAEIGMGRAQDINDKHIPTATDELDAVVAATAEATGAIMDACEVIEGKASDMGGDVGDSLSNEVTKIYEACSFQDITGQRIKKVVSTLRTIEEKVSKLILALSENFSGEDSRGEEDDTRSIEERLLNGPQMPDKAISQEDIDKLLSEFD